MDVVSFTLVNLPVPAPHPPAIRDVASNDTARDGRAYFLLLDDIHTLRSSTDQVRATARRLVERLGPHDQIAVQWLSLGKAGAREFTTK
jgi:hypothetical protein